MEKKIWLEESFCPVDRYNCLMPIEYEAEEINGAVKCYQKSRMVCRHVLNGVCDKGTECEFFKKAPEVLEKNAIWYEG